MNSAIDTILAVLLTPAAIDTVVMPVRMFCQDSDISTFIEGTKSDTRGLDNRDGSTEGLSTVTAQWFKCMFKMTARNGRLQPSEGRLYYT